MPALEGKGPIEHQHRFSGWTTLLHSEAGGGRDRPRDAWRVLPDTPLGDGTVHVLALFGADASGHAARQAAEALPQAVEEGGSLDGVLHCLDHAVQKAQGTTSAVVVLLHDGRPEGGIACVGDGAAYSLDDGGHILRITPEGSTDRLGGSAARGHVAPLRLGRSAPLMLCTNSVGHVAPEDLEALLQTPPGAREAALELLLDQVREAHPDEDRTLLLAHPEE